MRCACLSPIAPDPQDDGRYQQAAADLLAQHAPASIAAGAVAPRSVCRCPGFAQGTLSQILHSMHGLPADEAEAALALAVCKACSHALADHRPASAAERAQQARTENDAVLLQSVSAVEETELHLLGPVGGSVSIAGFRDGRIRLARISVPVNDEGFG